MAADLDTLLVAFYSLARGNGASDIRHGEVEPGRPGGRRQWYVAATMPNGVVVAPSAYNLAEAALRAAETLLGKLGCTYCERTRALPVLGDQVDPLAPMWRHPCRWYLIDGQWRPGCRTIALTADNVQKASHR